MTSDDIDEDVERMIRVNIDKTLFLSQRLASAPPHYLNYVVDTLRNGAQGMFLLPKYMVEDLNSKGSIAEISAFLLDLPLGLHEYYLLLLERMDLRWRPMAKRIFTWVVWVKRPLSLPELKEILEIDGNEYPNLALDAKAACGCLLSIEEGEIRLSHSSVKRFYSNLKHFEKVLSSASLSKLIPMTAWLWRVLVTYLSSSTTNLLVRLNAFLGGAQSLSTVPARSSGMQPFIGYHIAANPEILYPSSGR
jgi:hypothetical protein